jgi:hypothetical protein
MNMKDVRYVPYSGFLLQEKVDNLTRYLRLCAEYGCPDEGKEVFDAFKADLDRATARFEALVAAQSDPNEPDGLDAIRPLRPNGPRKMTAGIPEGYAQRLRGAFYGRMAGCTLGAALEFQTVGRHAGVG